MVTGASKILSNHTKNLYASMTVDNPQETRILE